MFGSPYISGKKEKGVYWKKMDVLYNISIRFVGRKPPTKDR